MRTAKESKAGIIFIYVILILSAIVAPTFMILEKDSFYTMAIRPLTWIVLFLICVILTLNEYSRIGKKKEIAKSIFIVTGIYLVIYYLIGIIIGYQYSPFSHSLNGIVNNFWSMVLIIILQEYVRAALINNSKKTKYIYVLVTILFILIEFNWKTCIDEFSSTSGAIKYTISTIIPLIVKHTLCTYLAKTIGYLANILYRAPIMLATILSPIIPNFNWFFTGAFEIIMAYILYFTARSEFQSEILRVVKARKRGESLTKNIIFVVVLSIFVLFVAGAFKYMPVAILSNSMKPCFSRGDIVVVEQLKKPDQKDFKEGEIVEYVLDGKVVVHRIIKIVDEKKGIYITKGDNNNAPDTKNVTKEQIIGKVKFSVKFIGYPSVWFSNLIDNSKPVGIETGK